MQVREKLEILRKKMQENRIDVCLYRDGDPHHSEIVSEYFKKRKWISGFTGSNGTAVITRQKALLWTDGRYYIQAARELEGSGFKMMKLEPDIIKPEEWIGQHFKEQATIRISTDMMSISCLDAEDLLEKAGREKTELTDLDILELIWQDRPELPLSRPYCLSQSLTGENRAAKLARIRKTFVGRADCFLMTTLDDIAWTLNLRGEDIRFSPVNLAFLMITANEATLFINGVDEELKNILLTDNIHVRPYDRIEAYLKNLKDCCLAFDFNQAGYGFKNRLNQSVQVISLENPALMMKALKNETEIEHINTAQLNEALVLLQFQYWLLHEAGEISETDAAEKITALRKSNQDYVFDSFATISAYAANAAMMHYSSYKNPGTIIRKKGFLLVDTGGNYKNGTTDTTRTYVLGELSEEEKYHYTLVLKSHINLARSKFLKGTPGRVLDGIARQPVWNEGLDYKCGTGHGVGFFLNVHEGPQSMSPRPLDVPIMEGMVSSIEPGIYIENKHGIRIENLYLCRHYKTTASGEFLEFKTLTYLPIDTEALLPELLLPQEKDWLNDYHAQVEAKLKPHLEPKYAAWLKEKTRPI